MGCMFEAAKRSQCNEITPKDKRPPVTAATPATQPNSSTSPSASASVATTTATPAAAAVQPFTEGLAEEYETTSPALSEPQFVDPIELQIQSLSKYFPSPSISASSSDSHPGALFNSLTADSSNKTYRQQSYKRHHRRQHQHVEAGVEPSAPTSGTAVPAGSARSSSSTLSTSTKCNLDEYIRAGHYITSSLFNCASNSSLTSRRSNSLLNSRTNYINTHSKGGACSATTPVATAANTSPSIRNSISLYAASSVILVLCYLTSSTSAAAIDHPIFDESSSDKEILDHLLEKSRYDKRLLPPVNGTLTVNVNVLLLSLASPDESSLKYEVEFLLNQQWNDPRLQYGNKSQYDYLNALHHHESIWTPDTYFIMHGDFKDPIIPMHFALRIYRNGTITYAMRRHLILSCQGSLHIFPFDDPKCSFSMESISYELSHIKYVWKNDEDTLRKSPSLTTLNAYLIQNATVLCSVKSWRGNYSCLKVELMFTRDRAFYFTTVFIPGIILVTSSFITFWLEWNAVPARVMIGVTTMLNFFTTSNGFRSTLPVVSNLTAMNVWDGVCMCFIYASLLEFVCVNYVGRKRPLHNVVYRPGENPVTQRLPAVLSRIGVILASPLAATASPTPIPQTQPGMHFPSNFSPHALHHRGRQTDITTTTAAVGMQEPVYAETVEVCRDGLKQRGGGGGGDGDGRQSRSMGTNTPALVVGGRKVSPSTRITTSDNVVDVEMTESQLPVKPPRRKSSRSTTPSGAHDVEATAGQMRMKENLGEKKRETGGPNEIVACTNCGGGSSPCTHSANNGCATETCFVQVRKKEPPHPIRVAKTIDVIARITFPTAYAIFLIFFFVHYKGFS